MSGQRRIEWGIEHRGRKVVADEIVAQTSEANARANVSNCNLQGYPCRLVSRVVVAGPWLPVADQDVAS